MYVADAHWGLTGGQGVAWSHNVPDNFKTVADTGPFDMLDVNGEDARWGSTGGV